MKKGLTLLAISAAAILMTGCSGKNILAVGYENSVCEGDLKAGGVCGAPSSVYKYRDRIKRVQSDYRRSGYSKQLYFAVTRDGKILVKASRDGKWQTYAGSRYEREINKLLGQSGSSFSGGGDAYGGGGLSNDMAVKYKNTKASPPNTQTNVGRIIRDNGEYARTWVAPYVDQKGDLVSAHEIYAVVRNPKWIVGEKTPKNVVNASTPTPFNKKAYTSSYRKKHYGGYSTKAPKSKSMQTLKTFVEND